MLTKVESGGLATRRSLQEQSEPKSSSRIMSILLGIAISRFLADAHNDEVVLGERHDAV